MLSFFKTVFKTIKPLDRFRPLFARWMRTAGYFIVHKKPHFRLGWGRLFLLVFISVFIFRLFFLHADTLPLWAVVTAKSIQMHSDPKTDAPILKEITKGKRIQIVDQKDTWIKIIHEGQTGYIQKQTNPVFEKLESGYDPGADIEYKRKIEKLQKEATEINQKIKNRNAEINSIKKEERSILSNLNEIDHSLNKSKELSSLLKTDLALLSKKITATRNATQTLENKIQSSEKYAAQRLIALYKLNWLGKMHMIASADSMDEVLQRKIYLEHILEYDQKTIDQLIENKNQHKDLLIKLKAQQSEKLSLEKNYKNQINITASRKKEREKLLAGIQNKKSLQLTSINELKKASLELDRTIQSLSRRIDRSGTSQNDLKNSFSSFKGLLKMPVKGKIVSTFGPYRNKELNVMNYRNGIDIKAEKGEPIKAVMAGNVIFSNWFKGYGNMIILDHGNRYYTLYAHAEQLFKQTGQRVEAGEIIAIVGDTGSLAGSKLYFEIRHQDKPVNPLTWLNVKN